MPDVLTVNQLSELKVANLSDGFLKAEINLLKVGNLTTSERSDFRYTYSFIIIFFQKIKFLLLRLQKKEQHDKCK